MTYDDVPAESVPCSQVSVSIKTVGWSQEITAAERNSDGFMRAMIAEAEHQLRRHIVSIPVEHAGFVMSAVDDATSAVVASTFVVEVEVPAVRRWWHRLLFLHPMTTEVQRQYVPGDVPHADFYRVAFEQHAASVPPDMAGRVRADMTRDRALTFAALTPRAWDL